MTHPDEDPPRPEAEGDSADPAPDGADLDGHDGDEGGETAAAVIESAAGFVVAAAVAPFAAGETGPIMGSVHDVIEEGIQRLTHLGHPHEAPANEAPATTEAPPQSEDDPPA